MGNVKEQVFCPKSLSGKGLGFLASSFGQNDRSGSSKVSGHASLHRAARASNLR